MKVQIARISRISDIPHIPNPGINRTSKLFDPANNNYPGYKKLYCVFFFRKDTTTTVAVFTTASPPHTKGDEITNSIEAENSSESQRNEIQIIEHPPR